MEEDIQKSIEWFDNKNQEPESIAKEILKNKKRVKYYVCDGTLTGEDYEIRVSRFIPFTDDEVARIKNLLVDTFNKEFKGEGSALESYDDILKEEFDLGNFESSNAELDELLFDRCYNIGVSPKSINFNKVMYLYRMSYTAYDIYKLVLNEPQYFTVELTDDEYIYLLTKQIKKHHYFTYNELIAENPDLAVKINTYAYYDDDYEYMPRDVNPFFIQFDEVADDVLNAIGPKIDPCLFCDPDDKISIDCYSENWYMKVVKCKMNYICDNEERDCGLVTYNRIEGISIKKLMELLGAKSYPNMIYLLEKKFNTETAYDDIRKFLTENGFEFKESSENVKETFI